MRAYQLHLREAYLLLSVRCKPSAQHRFEKFVSGEGGDMGGGGAIFETKKLLALFPHK